MKTFKEFISEVYDPEVQGRSQIRKQGEGGRVGSLRKKSEPEKRRMKAAGGGKMVPAKDYKDRKDIGGQRKRAEREQQPTQARGSARLDPRAAQRKAAMERRAAKSSGKTTKLRSQALAKKADSLLATKKKQKVDPRYKPQKQSVYTRDEKHRMRNAAMRLVRDMSKGKEKPASAYDPQIKNFGKQTGSSAYSNTGIVKKGRKKGS